MKKKRFFYKPRLGVITLDAFVWTLAIVAMTLWRIVDNKEQIVEYINIGIVLYGLNLVFGYFCGKFRRLRKSNYKKSMQRAFFTFLLITASAIGSYYAFYTNRISLTVVIWIIVFAFALNIVYLACYYAYRYALNIEDGIVEFNKRPAQKLVLPKQTLSPEAEQAVKKSILEISNKRILNFLENNIDLSSSSTLVLATSTLFNIKSLGDYNFDCIVNLKRLNDMRGVNKMFCAINEKLPDDGLFVCCFKPQRFTKDAILHRFPKIINYIVYTGYFIYRRIIPKLFFTSRLYYDITNGKNRVFSTTEVLGRLYFCGFKVLQEVSIGSTCMVIAQREKQPEKQIRRKYGPFIKLMRVGKNGKKFGVYKFRTMHPYSEFLQAYMYEKHNLQKGGKIKNDIRVSTLGHFMRKYWIDELPMLLNFVKGDMKLVGVRPLSKHYFSLYTKELQEKRTQFKPGLLPPFYADEPSTLDEIQASEMRYLVACEQNGVLRTDFAYFWKIVYRIVFKHAHSN